MKSMAPEEIEEQIATQEWAELFRRTTSLEWGQFLERYGQRMSTIRQKPRKKHLHGLKRITSRPSLR